MLRRTAALFLFALVAACGSTGRRAPMHPESPPGSWYVVGRGETLAEIAARAGVPAEDILELNGIARADQVTAGRLIYVLAGPQAPPPAGDATPPSPAMTMAAAAAAATFRWPLEQRVAVGSPFGTRDGRPHEGIDLPAASGTPVVAAADGEVVYAGDAIRGYGNLIVLAHPGNLMTVYAHNSVLLVRQGDRVVAGQRVALVGKSGHATGPHLHFEVRQGQIPRDPLPFLTADSSTGGTP